MLVFTKTRFIGTDLFKLYDLQRHWVGLPRSLAHLHVSVFRFRSMSFLYNVQSFSRLSQPVGTFDIDSLIDLFDPPSYVCMFYHNYVTCVLRMCVYVLRVCVTFVL